MNRNWIVFGAAILVLGLYWRVTGFELPAPQASPTVTATASATATQDVTPEPMPSLSEMDCAMISRYWDDAINAVHDLNDGTMAMSDVPPILADAADGLEAQSYIAAEDGLSDESLWLMEASKELRKLRVAFLNNDGSAMTKAAKEFGSLMNGVYPIYCDS